MGKNLLKDHNNLFLTPSQHFLNKVIFTIFCGQVYAQGSDTYLSTKKSKKSLCWESVSWVLKTSYYGLLKGFYP